MTAFTPGVIPAPPAQLTTPKLTYEIGDECWIYCGLQDKKTGRLELQRGKVVYWIDLPTFAMRFYSIYLPGLDWMQLETRDALRMAPSKEAGLPFTKTHHDFKPRKGARDWRNS